MYAFRSLGAEQDQLARLGDKAQQSQNGPDRLVAFVSKRSDN